MSTAALDTPAAQAPDPAKLDALVGRMLGDLGGAYILPLVRIGDELGLYTALAEGGPATPAELARRTGANERLLREWLSAHAAAGYLDHEAASGRFAMSPEQAMVFALPDSPAFMLGAFEVAHATALDVPQVSRAFRGDGRGAGYHVRCSCLFSGIERFFRPGYQANLVGSWLPALEGVVEMLERGGMAADVGCGHGASTILMAKAFPRSRFAGFDYHAASIARARRPGGRASRRTRASRRRARRTSRARGTTSSPASTRCTTWAIPSAWRGTSARRWRRTAPSWRWSRARATGWRTTRTRSGACTTRLPP